MQKLDRLNQEVAETKQRLDAIRGPNSQTVPKADEKNATVATEDTTGGSENPFSSFIKQVSLRQSVFDKDAFDKPAAISYTHPSSGSPSVAIDAGLKVEMQPKFIPWGATITSSLGMDYHRNTSPGALKDLFEVGGQFEHTLGFAATWGLSLDTAGDIAYKVDKVRHIDSIEGSIKTHPVFTFEKMGLPALSFLNTDNYHQMGCVRWNWEPFVGAQYEDTTGTGSGVQSGHHLLIDYGVELRLYPFFKSIGKKVEITASYKGWQPVNPTGVFAGEQNSSYFETQITYFFVESNPIRIGEKTSDTLDMGLTFRYQNGDNLETGNKHLDLFIVALTGRF